MYNGIGLTTPRGSGTSGYVVRNLSALRHEKNRPSPWDDAALPKHREPDQGILEHEKKRRVEIKCLELQVDLEDKGVDEADIEKKVDELRQKLLANLASITGPQSLKPTDTHGMAAAKKIEVARMARAIGRRVPQVAPPARRGRRPDSRSPSIRPVSRSRSRSPPRRRSRRRSNTPPPRRERTPPYLPTPAREGSMRQRGSYRDRSSQLPLRVASEERNRSPTPVRRGRSRSRSVETGSSMSVSTRSGSSGSRDEDRGKGRARDQAC